MLVCVGSAMMMLVSMFGFAAVQNDAHVSFDPSRVAAQVISLFLSPEMIRGLTTAAITVVVDERFADLVRTSRASSGGSAPTWPR